MRIIRCFLILFFLFNNYCYSQITDSAIVKKNIKLRLYYELNIFLKSESAIKDYFSRELVLIKLESKGFDDIIFFKVPSQIISIDTVKTKNLIEKYIIPECIYTKSCEYIYGYNISNNNLYVLKGGKNNNIDELYNYLQYSWPEWKPINRINNKLIKNFQKNYWIEDLDLACLLSNIKTKKGVCYTPPKKDIIIY